MLLISYFHYRGDLIARLRTHPWVTSFYGPLDAPFRNLIEAYRDDMEPLRRTMRDQYRPAFDRLWEHAYDRAPSGKMADRGDPERVILFSMLVGLQQEVLELREQLAESDVRR